MREKNFQYYYKLSIKHLSATIMVPLLMELRIPFKLHSNNFGDKYFISTAINCTGETRFSTF